MAGRVFDCVTGVADRVANVLRVAVVDGGTLFKELSESL